MYFFLNLLGIDFVKINDDEAAKKYGIVHAPALIYFRKRTPMVYDGINKLSLSIKKFNFIVIEMLLKVIYWMNNVF